MRRSFYIIALLTLAVLAGCSKKDQDLPGPDSPLLFVPSAFTPNGDGVNDSFKVKTDTSFSYFRLSVYDPNNVVIFMADNPKSGWDGRYASKPVPAGSYLWIVDYELPGSSRFQRRGYVELVR